MTSTVDCEADAQPPSKPAVPFGKAVGQVFRAAKERIADNPAINSQPIDPQVKEQFNADMDRMIEKHEGKKDFPGRALGGETCEGRY